MIGGGIGAVAGMLLAIEQQNVTPNAYLPRVTFFLYVIVILGGAGTIWGRCSVRSSSSSCSSLRRAVMVSLQADGLVRGPPRARPTPPR